jgi:hypothetical protein
LAHHPKANIINPGNLTFVHKDDRSVKIHAISIQKDGKTKVEVKDIGSPDGKEITLRKNGLSKIELKAWAERELAQLSFSGYKGSFDTLAKPFSRHGDVAVLEDPQYPDYNGSYLIKKTTTKLNDTSGLIQSIELDRKIS